MTAAAARGDDSSLVIATTTVASDAQAQQLAAAIVQQRLAACVQIDGPISSHYRWQAAVQMDSEWRLTIKTTAAGARKIQQHLPQLHPYELPQWVVVAASDASSDYRQWVQQAVADAPLDNSPPDDAVPGDVVPGDVASGDGAATTADGTAASAVPPTFHIYLYGRDRQPLPIAFELLFQRLDQQPRIHVEPDGSFVWSDQQGQIDGMIYDLGDAIQYLDLKGRCSHAQWRQLLAWLTPSGRDDRGTTDRWAVWSIAEQRLQDLQAFEKACWPGEP